MQATKPTTSNVNDEQWKAIETRDASFRDAFVLAVRTTGIYCRPGCPARTPLRTNIRLYTSAAEAERSGYRACKRCTPRGESIQQRHTRLVAEACRSIESALMPPRLEDLAREAGMSPYHFHRTFRAITGVTPKGYAKCTRAGRIRDQLGTSSSVTFAMYGSGFESRGSFYEAVHETIGMTPTTYRRGGAGTRIRYAFGQSSFGTVLVASTDRGICAIYLEDDEQALVRNLQEQFPNAELVGDDPDFAITVKVVVEHLDEPQRTLGLPLDVQGTAFQHRVWQALREIPSGSTVTYSEIAERIGSPGAIRAVARACATNNVAVAIPCHRVVRKDGTFSGYRWGRDLKRRLVEHEASN